MRTKEASKILNCSSSTVTNWLKAGKLRLNKVLPNGYRDINEESVYELVASTYEPDRGQNRIVVLRKDGSVMKFEPDDSTVTKVVAYLAGAGV